jgi:hypothetical protein
MIYQSVTSDIVPGKMAQYDEIVAKEMVPLMAKFGIKLVGAWHCYTGNMNKIHSLYVFDNLAAYQKIATTRDKDPEFQKVSAKLSALRTGINYTFLDPASWSPMK